MIGAYDGAVKLGWDDRLARSFAQHRDEGHQPGRVISEERGRWLVATGGPEVWATVSGRLRHQAASAEDLPAVGDWVALSMTDGGDAVVHEVLPRRSRFARPARGDVASAEVVAANIDLVIVVMGLDHDFNLRRLERYLALSWTSGADPVIVLNKADICPDPGPRLAEVRATAPWVPVVLLSARVGTGLDALQALLEPGRTVCLVGSSGVGKSTIVNSLLGWQRQATREVREDDQRGRHTTTRRELLVMPSGALIIDSPGMRSVGMWDADEGIDAAFADIEALAGQCRFTDCSHESEPGCAVREAVQSGDLAASRLESRRKLAREAAAEARKHDANLRANERRRWKAIQKSVRNHQRVKYGPESA